MTLDETNNYGTEPTDAEVEAEYIAESGDISEPVEDPNPLGVDVDEAVSNITGGEGEAMGKPRRLVAFVQLPDRRELDWQARNLLRESDIRDAMAQGARRLWDAFMQRNYNAIGYTLNPDDIEYDIDRLQVGMDNSADPERKAPPSLARVLVCTVLITRE